MSRTHSHTQIKHHIAMNCLFCKSSLVRIGFETLLRRFRVGSLVGRSKFPYLFGARDTISTNYTCCAVCTFHLLACQYTASGGMHQNVSYRSKFPYGLRTKHTRTPLFRSLLCRISSAQYTRLDLLAMQDIASLKNSYQPFFPRFHTKIPIGLTPSGFFSYSLVTCIKRGTRPVVKYTCL